MTTTTTTRPNPWVTNPPAVLVDAVDQDVVEDVIVPVAADCPVVLLGAHGGAGTTTLAALTGLREASSVVDGDRVVLVARTHATGLVAAQRLAAKLVSFGAVLEGLVLVADAPGRRPKPLADLAVVLGGVVPPGRVWPIAWTDVWRVELTPTTVPRLVRKVVRDLVAAVGSGVR